MGEIREEYVVDEEDKETLKFGAGGHFQRPHLFFPLALSNRKEYLYKLALDMNEDYGIRARVHEGLNALVVPVSDIGGAVDAIQGLFVFLFGAGYFFDDQEDAGQG